MMAIGTQAHLNVSVTFDIMDQSLAEMKNLGLPIHVTDLDVNGAVRRRHQPHEGKRNQSPLIYPPGNRVEAPTSQSAPQDFSIIPSLAFCSRRF